MADSIKTKLDYQSTKVKMQRIETSAGIISFAENKAILTPASKKILDRVGAILQRQPNLSLEIKVNQELNEQIDITEERSKTIAEYLESKWQINNNRVNTPTGTENQRTAKLKLIV